MPKRLPNPPYKKENIRRDDRVIITLEIANKIRADYETGNYRYRHLCAIYGISASTISQIIRNEIWI